MIGAILGDIIGSPYEFDRGNKSKEFPLFSRDPTYTDDTVMTLAVSLTFLDAQPSASDDWILQNLANRMRQFGKMYPNAEGTEECSDNGFVIQSARLTIVLVMALQCVFLQLRGYITILMLSDTLTRLSAKVTHNHLEGIKGAEATASAIFPGKDRTWQDRN